MHRYNKTSLNKPVTLEIISPYNTRPCANFNKPFCIKVKNILRKYLSKYENVLFVQTYCLHKTMSFLFRWQASVQCGIL